MKQLTRARLAMALSSVKGFPKPKVKLEQYPTDSEVASQLLWQVFMKGWLDDAKVADLGCGTGVLSVGVGLLGASEVLCVDTDEEVFAVLQEEVSKAKDCVYASVHCDISEFDREVDLVVMNPPFGTKLKGADKAFLEVAARCSDRVVSLHKTSTADFVRGFMEEKGFTCVEQMDFSYPLPKTYGFQKKKREMIEVSGFLFERS